MPQFQRYAAFYDLLYRDKDYEAEARYVARKLREARPDARTILELGSGTGHHGRLLASMGFDVHGIERSAEMVAVAQLHEIADAPGSFSCEVGDICNIKLSRRFDSVISLYHVISYQTSNEALQAAFAAAAEHLAPGGVFLFDVWHGPAVLTQGVSERVKEVEDDLHRLRRLARPTVDTNQSTVKVIFDMECEDKRSGQVSCFSEDHSMRYLFPTEIDLLARVCGLQLASTEEFLTGHAPTPSTWGVAYLLVKLWRPDCS
jgi:SAM-dependent methyltransferase